MAKLNRTQNKLLKSGFLPVQQDYRFEVWTDVTQGGTNISFYVERPNEIDGAFKIHGRRPDEPQCDLFYSTHSKSLKDAISLSRL
jgi:hypothetical protein